jgi:hypothetical protein
MVDFEGHQHTEDLRDLLPYNGNVASTLGWQLIYTISNN